MKVCMLGSSLQVNGGMSSVIRQILSNDWAGRVEIRFIPTHQNASLIRRCLFFAYGYLRLAGILLFRNQSVDIVHMHMSYKGSFYRKYLLHRLVKLFGKPDIVHLHGSEFKAFYDCASEAVRKRVRRLLRECDRVLVLGQQWEQIVGAIEPASRRVTLYNAVPIPGVQTAWDDEETRLLFMGALIPRKAVADLLYAVSILAQRNKRPRRFTLFIAGSGCDQAALEQKTDELGIRSHIRFLGWIDHEEKERLLSGCQCLILPSVNEGLPVAILEAMSYGMPVISTNVGSIAEALCDGVNGRMVDVHSPEQIALAVEAITSRRETWQAMSRQSRSAAEARFDERVFFARLEDIYASVMKENP